MNYIHKIGNCFVSTSYSEGVGLGMIDAAYYGNTIITNSFSGILEYLPYILSCNFVLTNVEDDYVFYDSKQIWGTPLKEDVINKMKIAFKNRQHQSQINCLNKLHISDMNENLNLNVFNITNTKATKNFYNENIYCSYYDRNMYLLKHDLGICIHLKNGNCWNIDVETHLKSNLNKNDNVFEIGSYIGIHSHCIKKKIQAGVLVCIEAQPRVFETLKLNMNSYSNCHILNCIVSNNLSIPNGVNLLEFYNQNPGGNCTYKISKNTNSMFKVETTTIDSLQEMFNVIPNVVKINVNSDNYAVVQGMMRVLKSYKPKLYISKNKDFEKIESFLCDIGYKSKSIGNNTNFFES